MKEDLKRLVEESGGSQNARNRMREYLQAQILGSLQRAGAFVPLAFQGGTALRFLFAIRRYFEDLDFALERRDRGYDFRTFLKAIEGDLAREGYDVGIKANDRKIVNSAFISFPGLLYEMGLSPHRNESLSVKVEVDTNPPEGAILETTIVRRHLTLRLQHHDRSSLLAGKIHAILQRTYPKGRDVYDLIWYLSDPSWPSPNLVLLNNALRQSGWEGREVAADAWRELVRRRVETFDWDRVVADVQPFMETPSELSLISQESAVRVLASRAGEPSG
ncbi:MAG TPA: nucleotidyl transferase AbiEii/AbiGii toxin family protein [Thermoanaerobaculia bacterium]|jgi:predicted nucleotidyltransferase component of viral defense system|nr:nucleotidyl transferase AbiEii/AbiGii toxin family protein [Thermoanaerobaculia bacterium]